MEKFQMGHMNMFRQNWNWSYYINEKQNFQNDPNFSCGADEEYRDNPQCSWFLMNMYLIYYINQQKNPQFDSIPNTGFQIVLVKLFEDMYHIGFDGSFQKHVGISKEEFYEKYNDFIKNSEDVPPEGFFPDNPLTELVDFWSIDSSQ